MTETVLAPWGEEDRVGSSSSSDGRNGGGTICKRKREGERKVDGEGERTYVAGMGVFTPSALAIFANLVGGRGERGGRKEGDI